MFSIADFPTLKLFRILDISQAVVSPSTTVYEYLLPANKIGFVSFFRLQAPTGGSTEVSSFQIDDVEMLQAGSGPGPSNDHQLYMHTQGIMLVVPNANQQSPQEYFIPFRRSVRVTLIQSLGVGNQRFQVRAYLAEDPEKEFQNTATISGSTSI